MATDRSISSSATAPASESSVSMPTTRSAEPGIGELEARSGGRFQVRELLGTGAYGAVYHVFDRNHERSLALKLLLRLGPEDLVRFKREFRIVSNVSHPNLVAIHELFVDEAGAWLTMDLVHGTDFLSWVRDGNRCDEARLREALRQLAEGLVALHAYRILHRDLKPSNVLVRADGQVLVADFGLARQLVGQDEDGVAGTPAYMSPEQAANLELTTASDWYCFGVMMYEALTGERPHSGLDGIALMMAKQAGHPGPPSARAPGIAADLDRLCSDLLARDGVDRPSGAEVLGRLGRAAAGPPLAPAAVMPDVFVGRADELAALERCWQRVRSSASAAIAIVEGRSGTGKSALVRHFLSHAAVGNALALRGRCYERESVPYKGLDELVDDLRRFLLTQGNAGAVAGAGALGRLFPVLADVPGVGDAPVPRVEDPVELRRQAVDALRELLHGVATSRPLVLALDDLQWCDDDTAVVLTELLRSRFRPPALFVACLRPDDGEPTTATTILARGLAELGDQVSRERIVLGPLTESDAMEIAEVLLPARHDRDEIARAIVAECDGNPLFVAELVRHTTDTGDPGALGRPQLDAIIQARVARLPAAARAVLECLAVAARPIPQRVVLAAARAHERGLETIALLRAQAFVQTHGADELSGVEASHDRVAVAVRAAMTAERIAATHLALATQLQRHGGDAEEIAFHFKAAGEPSRAIEYVTLAAELAGQALAFNRAARLFRLALELLTHTDPRRHSVQRALADTLARDGRGAAAAAAYVTAADTAAIGDVLELRRAAAEQLLRSGRLVDGLAMLREVLRAVGLRLPHGPRSALAALLAARTGVRLRGLEFVERAEQDVDRNLLLRIDTTWAAATGLLQSSVLLGQYFQARHLMLALDGGEPRRIARALGLETLYAATDGTPGLAACDALLDRVEGLCRRVDDPRALGIAGLAAGVADVYRGRFVTACPRLAEAEKILRERCTNVQWELGMVRTFLVMALFYVGELAGMREVLELGVRDAIDRDDLHTQLMLRLAYEPMALLVENRVDRADAVLAEVAARWPAPLETATYRYVLAMTRSRIDRYAGRGVRALAAIDEHWQSIERSFMLTKQPLRLFMLHERGCAALAAAAASDGRQRKRLLARARADAERLVADGSPWSQALALPLLASLYAVSGDTPRARETLVASERAFMERGMPIYAAVMLRRRGQLIGGGGGDDMIARADAALTKAGVVAPARLADQLAPPIT